MGALSVEQILAEEALKIHGIRSGDGDDKEGARQQLVAGLSKLETVQAFETERGDKDADARSGKDEDPAWAQKRKNFYCDLNRIGRAALCCSGGGIRSATFCLGIIQALAQIARPDGAPDAGGTTAVHTPDGRAHAPEDSLLSCFHYLSTVSGGGYIGSWLSAWRQRNDFETVWKYLAGRPEGPDVEPPEISWLRAYSNYLTPKIGLASADTWTGIAIYLRNLILNWLVIVPALAAVILVLKVIITLSVGEARIESVWWPQFVAMLIGAASLIVAQAYTTAHRPTRRMQPGADTAHDPNNIDQNAFILRDLPWSLVSAILITSALTSSIGTELAHNVGAFGAIAIGAVVGVLIYAAGWLIGHPAHGSCKDFGRFAASGLVYGGVVGLGAHLYAGLMPYADSTGHKVWMILLPVILGVPWVLLGQLFADMVFVGLVSYEVNSDADREWLGRAAGWVAAAGVAWVLTTFVVFAGGYLLIDVAQEAGKYVAGAGGISGIVTAWLGKSAKTPAKPGEGDQGFKTIAYSVALAIAGPIFAAILVVGISVGLDMLLLGDSLVGGLAGNSLETWPVMAWLALGFAIAFLIAWIASRCVNINRFSIHALYRNRLVRAYLGASRQERCPDRFTGFDRQDNLPAHWLWPPKPPEHGHNTFCLFHVVNITLNVVKTARLAWQQRKAESFTVSPLHCGAAYKGYRHSDEYGGKKPYGLSLGTAMAISGAAASPNMGYNSSPSITLLLALFNVRLGWWLGNPGKEGDETYTEEGPSTAIRPAGRGNLRADHRHQALGLSLRRRPFRESRHLRDGAAALPLHRGNRRRLRSRLRFRRSRQCRAQDLHRSRRAHQIRDARPAQESSEAGRGQSRQYPLLRRRHDLLRRRRRRRLSERADPLHQAGHPRHQRDRRRRRAQLRHDAQDVPARVDRQSVVQRVAVRELPLARARHRERHLQGRYRPRTGQDKTEQCAGGTGADHALRAWPPAGRAPAY